ncbi:Uncharacterised protein [Helicobacter pametensis]|nr:Uncharacterised protein [Helicobacter pametensis]
MNDGITKEEIEKILCGNAILFVGAGFSDGAIGYSGELPTSKKLAKIICELGDIPEVGQEDLQLDLIADYFIENFPEKRKTLVNKLKDIFSVRDVRDFHQTIASLPWKRIYTTNYDNLVERASKTRIDGIDLDDPIPDKERYCLHINGRIENLTEEKLNNTFKLSRSSYISSSNIFTNNKWKKMFEDDLDISSLIVFIGYSLYDSDIESTLFGKAHIKDKTIFVMKKGEKKSLKDFKYEKYGRLLKIGAEGFADFFKNKRMIEQERIGFLCLEQYKNLHLDKIEKIEDKDRIAFFLTGSIDDKIIQYATLKGDHMNLILPRKDLRNRAIEILEKKQNLILSGGLGNGKTIFLRQLATILANEYNVFFSRKMTMLQKREQLNH